jgi:transcriptional antiterminator RfaH
MPLHWYAINSHPHKEEVLWRHLQSQGIEVFYPRLRVTPVNPRSRKFRPYFPGYLFVHVDLDESGQSTFQWLPHARGIVSVGGEAAIVPDGLIGALRARLAQLEADRPAQAMELKPGDLVVIDSGPFEGYEAIFDVRISGSERVRVLLKMLNKNQVPLELKAGNIRRKLKPGC